MPGHLKDTVRGKHFTGHRKDSAGYKKWPDKERGGTNGDRESGLQSGRLGRGLVESLSNMGLVEGSHLGAHSQERVRNPARH